MNHILKLEADNIAKDAEIAALRESLRSIRDYALSPKFRTEPCEGSGRCPNINPRDIVLRVDEAGPYATEAANAAYYTVVGPKPEPSYAGWRCPVCKVVLPDVWNDTDAKAAARQYDHWQTTHRT